jgi:hypothetical protein
MDTGVNNIHDDKYTTASVEWIQVNWQRTSQWILNIGLFVCVRVRACVFVRVGARVRGCVCMCVRACVRACMYVCIIKISVKVMNNPGKSFLGIWLRGKQSGSPKTFLVSSS